MKKIFYYAAYMLVCIVGCIITWLSKLFEKVNTISSVTEHGHWYKDENEEWHYTNDPSDIY